MPQQHYQRFWKFSALSLANRLMLTSMFLFDVVVAGRQGDAITAGIMAALPVVLLIHAMGNGVSQATASRLTWAIGLHGKKHLWPNIMTALGAGILGAVGMSLAVLAFGPWLVVFLADTDQQLLHAEGYLRAMVPYAGTYVALMVLREIALALGREDLAFYQTASFFICKLVLLVLLETEEVLQHETFTHAIGMSSTWGGIAGMCLGLLVVIPRVHSPMTDSTSLHARLSEILSILRQGLYAALIPASYGAFYAVLVMLFLRLGSDVGAARSYMGELFLVLSAWPWAVATWGRIGVGLSCGQQDYPSLMKYIMRISRAGFLGVYPVLILLYAFADPLIALITPDVVIAEIVRNMMLVGLVGEVFRILSITLMNVLIAMDRVQGFASWGVILTWAGVVPVMLMLDATYQSYMLLTAFFYIEYLIRTVLGLGYLYKAIGELKRTWGYGFA